MTAQPIRAFAAVRREAGGRPYISRYHLHAYASGVRENVGRAFARVGETPAQGWKRALKRGWRVERVEVCLEQQR